MKKTFSMILMVFILVGCAAEAGDEEECGGNGACALRNDKPVPDVVGMHLRKACPALDRNGYKGGVKRIVEGQAKAGTVLELGVKPGKRTFEGAIIMMDVAAPVRLRSLPQGCVSRLAK